MWPPHESRNGLNVVSGLRKITHDILSVSLVQRGEDPIHPTFGLAPDLFEPLSNYAPEFWVYHAEETIIKWVAGIEGLKVTVVNHEDYNNQLRTEISFIPKLYPDVNILTWNYYDYQGAIWQNDFETFLDSVRLNGTPFRQLN